MIIPKVKMLVYWQYVALLLVLGVISQMARCGEPSVGTPRENHLVREKIKKGLIQDLRQLNQIFLCSNAPATEKRRKIDLVVQQAKELLSGEIAKKNAVACFYLGHIYSLADARIMTRPEHKGDPRRYPYTKEAMLYFQMAAKENHPGALAGLSALERGNERAQLMELAADHGHIMALKSLLEKRNAQEILLENEEDNNRYAKWYSRAFLYLLFKTTYREAFGESHNHVIMREYQGIRSCFLDRFFTSGKEPDMSTELLMKRLKEMEQLENQVFRRYLDLTHNYLAEEIGR